MIRRQVNKQGGPSSPPRVEDVEDPNEEGEERKEHRRPRHAVRYYNSNTPILLRARIMCTKIIKFLTEEDLSKRPSIYTGFIAFLGDVLLSITLASITIAIWLTFDHHHESLLPSVLHRHAHNFRAAAFTALNEDRQTLSTIEEGSNLKFMIRWDYESKLKEIATYPNKVAEHAEVLKERITEYDDKQNELKVLKEEFNILYDNPILEMDRYCPECKWGQGTCDARVRYLMQTYNTNLNAARVSAMTNASCKKKEGGSGGGVGPRTSSEFARIEDAKNPPLERWTGRLWD